MICYFVIDLKKRKKDIRKFITLIEETIIGRLSKFNIKTFGDPKNIAELAVFLASEKGQYITGQTISVDGGLYMI